MYGKPIDSIGFVSQFDAEIGAMMNRELLRQQDGIELIASENFASPAVIAAMGSILTNKYAEGLPGKRYYGGCEFVWSRSASTGPRLCSARSSPTSSPTPALPPTWPWSWPS